MTIPKNDELLDHARKLRREMTPHERKLWYLFLQKYPVKWYKQRIIGSYIVDFYCASRKLVVELDGWQHYEKEGMLSDDQRTSYLAGLGLKVIRFSNADIDYRFREVCELIHHYVEKYES